MVAGRYTKLAIWLHWLVAIGIFVNIALAWTWPSVPDAQVRPLIDLHKSIGITVLGLAIMRLLWRFTHTPPALPTRYQRWEITTSHIAHWTLYLLIFTMPITGWLHDSAFKDAAAHPILLFGIVPFPRIAAVAALDPVTKEHMHHLFGQMHEITAKVVYAVVALHILGALKHQFLDKEREIQRMWFWGTPE